MDRLETLSQAAANNPNDAGVWLELGDALLEIGAVDPAQHMVARARACEPASAAHWSALGALLLRLGDKASALEALRAATILDSEDRDAAALFAKTAIEFGAPEEAEDHVNRALCLANDPMRPYLLALAHEAQQRFSSALDHALQAVRSIDPPEYDSVALAARLANRLKRFDIEERSLLMLRQMDPENITYAMKLADCLVRRGRTDIAVEELDRISRLPSLQAHQREQLAERYLYLNETARAREQIEDAVTERPQAAKSWLLLARALELEGAVDDAVVVYRSALEVDPNRKGVHARLGNALFKAGRYAEATQSLVRAASETPDNQEVRAQLTRSLLMSGNVETQPAGEGSLSGDLSVFRVEELLEFLGVQRSTGKLLLTSKGRNGVVQIVEGKLTDAQYPGRPALSTVLVARGLVPKERLRTLPKEVLEEDPRLAQVLAEAGDVRGTALEQILRARIELGVQHILAWADGRARFSPEPSPGAPMFGFEHQQILMSVLTRMDEGRR